MENVVAAPVPDEAQDKTHSDVMLFNRWSYDGVEVTFSLPSHKKLLLFSFLIDLNRIPLLLTVIIYKSQTY